MIYSKAHLSTRHLFAILSIFFFVGILISGIVYLSQTEKKFQKQEEMKFEEDLQDFLHKAQDPSIDNLEKKFPLPSSFSDADEVEVLDGKDPLYDSGIRVVLKRNGKVIRTIKSDFEVLDDGGGKFGVEDGKVVLKSEDISFESVETKSEEVEVS